MNGADEVEEVDASMLDIYESKSVIAPDNDHKSIEKGEDNEEEKQEEKQYCIWFCSKCGYLSRLDERNGDCGNI